MDFSQFIFNESYTLSPYKICVAQLICSYLDYRQWLDTIPTSTPDQYAITKHGQLTYKLVMSSDCSYEELLFRIHNNHPSTEVLQIFYKEMNKYRNMDIKHFYDFFDKIRMLVQRKLSNNNYQIHKMSLIGVFFRKLIIYYERLSFCETSTLFDQLKKYVMVNNDQLTNNNAQTDTASEINNNEPEIEKLPKKINLENLKSKLNEMSNSSIQNEIYRQTLLIWIEKCFAKHQNLENQSQKSCQTIKCSNKSNVSKRKEPDDNSANDESMDIEHSTVSNQMDLDSSINDDGESSINDDQSMSLDQTVFDHRNERSLFVLDDESSLLSEDNTIDATNSTSATTVPTKQQPDTGKTSNKCTRNDVIEDGKRIVKKYANKMIDTSQHLVVKQIYKIQYNERLALTPSQITNYLRERFHEDNSFYYFRFITFNYLANLNLIRDQQVSSSGDGGGAGSGGQTFPMIPDGANANQAAGGGPALTIGPGTGNNITTGNNVGQQVANQVGNNNNQMNNNMFATVAGAGGAAGAVNGGGIIPTLNQMSNPTGATSTSNPGSTNSITMIDPLNKKYKSLFRSINFFNDIEYLKYINALRVNNYTLARKAFFDYFDLKKPSFDPDNGLGLLGNNVRTTTSNQTSTGHGPSVYHHLPNAGTNATGTTNAPSNPGTATNSGSISNHRSTNAGLMTNSTNYCWSSLNLAMMYCHFGYYRMAYDALVDCLSLAREKRDERCLQYAMLWILHIMQHLDHSNTKSKPYHFSSCSTTKPEMSETLKTKVYADLDLMENIISLILYNTNRLPYVAGKTFLHLYKLEYLKPTGQTLSRGQISLCDVLDGNDRINKCRSPLQPQSYYLSIRYCQYDMLAETITTYSAILNAYGSFHLAALFSKLLLRLDIFETVLDERVIRVDENTAIAARNMAHYLWFVNGKHRIAYEMISLYRKYISSYNQHCQRVLERALAEMMFERYLNIGQWNSAVKCVNVVRCVDRTRSYLMLAELRRRQNEQLAALECLDRITKPATNVDKSYVSKLSGTNGLSQANVPRNSSQIDHEERCVISNQPAVPKNFDQNQETSSRPATLFDNGILNMYERIQPPAPEELEPDLERPLITELDPYSNVECLLLRGIITEDLSILLECVVQCLSYGLRHLQYRALIHIARLQSQHYEQHHNAICIIESIMHGILSQSTLSDLALALHVYSSIIYRMFRQGSLPQHRSIIIKDKMDNGGQKELKTSLQGAMVMIKRAIIIREYIQDHNALYDSLTLASLIEHERNNLSDRNFYAKQAKIIRANRID